MSEYRVELVEMSNPVAVNLSEQQGPYQVAVRQLDVLNQGGTLDYGELENKPRINGVTLQGNKSSEEIGIEEITNIELELLLGSQI